MTWKLCLLTIFGHKQSFLSSTRIGSQGTDESDLFLSTNSNVVLGFRAVVVKVGPCVQEKNLVPILLCFAGLRTSRKEN